MEKSMAEEGGTDDLDARNIQPSNAEGIDLQD
jgi:hypothetical protein